MMTTKTQDINGLGDVVHLYDGFILDLWGVVHDGIKPFADTIPTLQEMKRAKRKIWLLSNAPRRVHAVVQKLTEMGVTPDLYDGIMTSGEATHLALQSRYLEKWGRRCLHMGSRTRDASIYEGLDIQIVDTPDEADFVLNSGIEDFSDVVEKYTPVLEACAARNLPMICANPDRIVHVEDKLVICAGTLADVYEQLDGQVVWYGKPYKSVYSMVLDAMGVGRVLAVGDSMITDIAGATGAGLEGVLVTSGIHREEFEGESKGENHLHDFLARYPFRPRYLLEKFKW